MYPRPAPVERKLRGISIRNFTMFLSTLASGMLINLMTTTCFNLNFIHSIFYEYSTKNAAPLLKIKRNKSGIQSFSKLDSNLAVTAEGLCYLVARAKTTMCLCYFRRSLIPTCRLSCRQSASTSLNLCSRRPSSFSFSSPATHPEKVKINYMILMKL